MTEFNLEPAQNAALHAGRQVWELIEQVRAAEVTNDEQLAELVDLMALMKKRRDAIEAKRKELKAHILQAGRALDGEFMPVLQTIDEEGMKVAKKKASDYMTWRDAERRKLEERRRKELEDNALDRAEELEKTGDKETADAIIGAASTLTQIRGRAAPARGSLGALSSKFVVDVQVVDMVAFIDALAAGELPFRVIDINQKRLKEAMSDEIDFSQLSEEPTVQHGVAVKLTRQLAVLT